MILLPSTGGISSSAPYGLSPGRDKALLASFYLLAIKMASYSSFPENTSASTLKRKIEKGILLLTRFLNTMKFLKSTLYDHSPDSQHPFSFWSLIYGMSRNTRPQNHWAKGSIYTEVFIDDTVQPLLLLLNGWSCQIKSDSPLWWSNLRLMWSCIYTSQVWL